MIGLRTNGHWNQKAKFKIGATKYKNMKKANLLSLVSSVLRYYLCSRNDNHFLSFTSWIFIINVNDDEKK